MTLSDPKVAALLNESTIPCWESIRPVPKVTVDFGGGRRLQRTLGGNTVAMLCLADGTVVDAFPGIYTADALVQAMEPALEFVRGLGAKSGPAARQAVLEWHGVQAKEAVRSEIMRVTMSKAFVESPLLKAMGVARGTPTPDAAPVAIPSLKNPLPDPKAALARLSAGIEDVSKRPATLDELRSSAGGEASASDPTLLGRQVVEWDSRINMRVMRPAVHLLFAARADLAGPRAYRDAIYKELLHVEVNDPYLGLAAALLPGTPQ